MSLRRLERVALASPVILKAVVRVGLPEGSEVSRDFTAQFLPMLRFNNPKLSWALCPSDDVELVFSDSTKQVLKGSSLVQSHLLMQRLLKIDTDKHMLKDKYGSD